MRALKLMADYGCFPLWEASPGHVGNVDPETLPISESLKTDLARWAASYDKTLNADEPLRSGFEAEADEKQFKQQGHVLGKRLQAELGADWMIKVKV
jgi:hypothetical protein